MDTKEKNPIKNRVKEINPKVNIQMSIYSKSCFEPLENISEGAKTQVKVIFIKTINYIQL